jgi:hypothetical protein
MDSSFALCRGLITVEMFRILMWTKYVMLDPPAHPVVCHVDANAVPQPGPQ